LKRTPVKLIQNNNKLLKIAKTLNNNNDDDDDDKEIRVRVSVYPKLPTCSGAALCLVA